MRFLNYLSIVVSMCIIFNSSAFSNSNGNEIIDLNKLEIKVEKINSVHIGTKLYITEKAWVFRKIIIDKNRKILGFVNKDDHYTLWINGKKTIQIGKIIQPIKNEKIFLLFDVGKGNGGLKAAFYNLDTSKYKVFPGKFNGLEDIDNDGLPEILTIEEKNGKCTIYVYKIINQNDNFSMGLFVSNMQPDCSYDTDYIPDYAEDIFWVPIIKYSEKDNIVYFEKKIEIEKDNQGKTLYDNYFEKWNKGGVKITSTLLRNIDSPFYTNSDDYVKRISLNKLDIIKLYSSGFNKNGYCFIFNFDGYRGKEGRTYFERYVRKYKKYKNFEWYELPKLLVCTRGKGYTRLSDGTLAIFDFDWRSTSPLILLKKNINGNDLVLISSPKKYLIIYDLKKDEAKMFLWKDILGYQPYAVKYFDGEKLVVVDNNSKINVYNVYLRSSKIEKEEW